MSSTFRNLSPIGGPIKAVTHKVELSSGHGIPALGFGTYRLRPSDCGSAVACALKNGFRHFDCSPVYDNQRDVGAALREAAAAAMVKRDDLFITSKLWMTQQAPEDVEAACRATMDDLNVDYLDLMLMHWPVAWKPFPSGGHHPDESKGELAVVNEAVGLMDTWAAMEGLVKKGLVKSIGVSNCGPTDVEHIVSRASVAPVTNQVELHPGLGQSHLRGVHTRLGMVTSSYCPLGMPTRFTPADFKGIRDHDFLRPISEQTGFAPARLLLNWNLDMQNVVVVKATSEKHIVECSKAQKFALSESVRWMLSHFEDQVQQIRVIDPKDFGRTFFQ